MLRPAAQQCKIPAVGIDDMPQPKEALMSKPAEPRDAPPGREEAPPPQIEVRNPRYEGATPEDVARTLLRPVKPRKPQPASRADTP